MKSFSKYLQILLGLVACLVVFDTVKATNLIKNPGFEISATSPRNWTITGPVSTMQPVTTLDSQTRFSGKFSLKMESSNPNCHGRASQIVEIVGGQTYLFKGRFKTTEVNSIDKSVIIRIKWLNKNEIKGYNYIYDIVNESDGWSLASNNVKAIGGATTAEISLGFRWGTGTIWWDDISLETCPDVPPRIVKVGTVYCKPPGPTVEKNLLIMGKLLDEAGRSGCQIVCLPEGWPTCNTGLGMKKTEVNTLGGSASIMLAQKAKKYGMYIVSGQYSWIGDTLNTVAV